MMLSIYRHCGFNTQCVEHTATRLIQTILRFYCVQYSQSLVQASVDPIYNVDPTYVLSTR